MNGLDYLFAGVAILLAGGGIILLFYYIARKA